MSSSHSLLALGRLAVFGGGGNNESLTLELVAAEILGGADTQGDPAGSHGVLI